MIALPTRESSSVMPHKLLQHQQDKWRFDQAWRELQALQRQYDEKDRMQQQEPFLGKPLPTERPRPSPEQIATNRREKQQRLQEARKRMQDKKKDWRRTYGSKTFGSNATSSTSSTQEFQDIRLSFEFEHAVERLNKFFQTHDVSVTCGGGSNQVRAHIMSVSIHPTVTATVTAALTVWVRPPLELFDAPYSYRYQDNEAFKMNLAKFVDIVMPPETRMYDDLQCLIHWKKSKTTIPLALSHLIPTRILLATDMAHVQLYIKYLDWLLVDPLVVTLFQSEQFYELFTIPSTTTTSSTASTSLSTTTAMEIEVEEEQEELKYFDETLENDEKTQNNDNDNDDDDDENIQTKVNVGKKRTLTKIEEPKRKRRKREKRQVVVSTRQLRPRRICTCHKFVN